MNYLSEKQKSPASEEITRIAKETVRRNGSHIPTLVILGNKDAIIERWEELPATADARAQCMYSAGFELARKKKLDAVTRVFFIASAWMSVVRQNDAIEAPPSQDPDRKQVLLIQSLKVDDRQTDMLVFEVLRKHNGRVLTLREFPLDEREKGFGMNLLLNAFIDGFQRGVRQEDQISSTS